MPAKTKAEERLKLSLIQPNIGPIILNISLIIKLRIDKMVALIPEGAILLSISFNSGVAKPLIR